MAIRRLGMESGLTFKQAATLSPEEHRLAEIIDVGIWSDEVEMLAKIYSYLLSTGAKKHIPWTKVLPARYLHSANLPDKLSNAELRARRRALSAQLDGFARKAKKLGLASG